MDITSFAPVLISEFLISAMNSKLFLWIHHFFRVSERQISIYKATDLSSAINTVGLDVSPAILIPFYDEDSSTLFLTGKVRRVFHFMQIYKKLYKMIVDSNLVLFVALFSTIKGWFHNLCVWNNRWSSTHLPIVTSSMRSITSGIKFFDKEPLWCVGRWVCQSIPLDK